MKNHIRQKVIRLIAKYKTDNPEEIAERENILIIKTFLGTQAGSYRMLDGQKVIFVNISLEHHQQKIVIAHELGHALLHPTINCCFIKSKTLLLTSKIERQANIFACELLLHDNILGDYIGHSLNEIAHAEYLPIELLELKFTTQI